MRTRQGSFVKVFVAALIVAGAALVPVLQSGAAVVIPAPEGPWGYTYGQSIDGTFATCNFYRVATGNGVAEELGTDITCADGLTFSPDGVLYGYTIPAIRGVDGESELVTIDPATGAQTVVGGLGDLFFEGGMTFDASGRLWLYTYADDEPCGAKQSCLFEVDPATAAVTVVGGEPGFRPTGLAADCSTVYAVGSLSSGILGNTLYTVDTTTAGVTEVGPTGLSVYTEGLDFAADGTLHTIGEPANVGPVTDAPVLATLDATTGAGSDEVEWISEDETPNIVFGLAIGGPPCSAPPEPVDILPNFTG